MKDFSPLETYLDGVWKQEPQKRAKAQNALEGLKAALKELSSLGLNFTLEADINVPLNDLQIKAHEAEVAAAPPPLPEPVPEGEVDPALEPDDDDGE